MSEAVASEAVEKFVAGLRYGVEVVGDCLGNWIPNGSRLVADMSEEVRPLRLVSITIRDSDGPWASWMRETGESSVCKIFLGRVPGTVLVGQLKPPVVCLIPETDIEAMHPIVGAVGVALEMKMSDRDRAAIQRLPYERHNACPRIVIFIVDADRVRAIHLYVDFLARTDVDDVGSRCVSYARCDTCCVQPDPCKEWLRSAGFYQGRMAHCCAPKVGDGTHNKHWLAQRHDNLGCDCAERQVEWDHKPVWELRGVEPIEFVGVELRDLH